MTEQQQARIKFSIPCSQRDAGARLEEVIRWMTGKGLIVEAYDLNNAETEDITPREQPPTDQPS